MGSENVYKRQGEALVEGGVYNVVAMKEEIPLKLLVQRVMASVDVKDCDAWKNQLRQIWAG